MAQQAGDDPVLIERFEAGLRALARSGLDLAAVLPTAECARALPRLAVRAESHPRLLLLGSSGPGLWSAIRASGGLDRPDPVDAHCAEAIGAFRASLAPLDAPLLWPGPGPDPLPVTRLARLAGWGLRSPLGIDVHPERGLWSAYRAVLLLAAPLPLRREARPSHPCEDCADRPCRTACPVGAVGGREGLEVEVCFAERTRAGAPCADRCAARLACPLGAAYRYPDAQIAHHQRAGNRLWLEAAAVPLRKPPEWAE